MYALEVFKHVGLENLTELVQYNDLTGKFVAYRTFNKDRVLFIAQLVSEKCINFHCNSLVSIKNKHVCTLSQALNKLAEKNSPEQVFIVATNAEKHAYKEDQWSRLITSSNEDYGGVFKSNT